MNVIWTDLSTNYYHRPDFIFTLGLQSCFNIFLFQRAFSHLEHVPEFIFLVYLFYGHFEACKKFMNGRKNNNAVLNFNYTFTVRGPFYYPYIKTYLIGRAVNPFKIQKVKKKFCKFFDVRAETNLYCQIDWHIKTRK